MKEIINKLCGTNLFLLEEKQNLDYFLRATPLDIETEEYLDELYEKLNKVIIKDISFYEEYSLEYEFKEEKEIFEVLVSVKSIFINVSILNTMFKLMESKQNLNLFSNNVVKLSEILDKTVSPKINLSGEFKSLIDMDKIISNYSIKNNINSSHINENFFFSLIK